MKKIPIIIDTDPGVDDFFCLAVAGANLDRYDLRAVTTIGGNHYTRVTTRNALNILHLLHIDAPVAAGADSFLYEPFGEPVALYHGANGIGEQELPVSPRQPDPLKAWDKIYEVAKECGGKLWLVTVGPQTNVAMAFQKYPDLPKLIERIVVMGGSTDRGNMTPFAEANIYHDAYASKIVFESGVPIDMIGLNVTRLCGFDCEAFDKMAARTRSDVKEIMRGLITFRNGEPMHDAIAIGSMIDEDMFTWEEGTIRIVTEDKTHIGQTVVEPASQGTGCHRAAVGVDVEKYLQMIARMVNYYDEAQGTT